MQKVRFLSLGREEIPWRGKWQPTPVLCLENPWTEEPGGLQSMGSQRVTEHSTLLCVFPEAAPQGLPECEGLCARAPVCACTGLCVLVGFQGSWSTLLLWLLFLTPLQPRCVF